MTYLTRLAAVRMMTAKTSPTGRTFEALAAKQRTADRFLNDIEILTQMIFLSTLLPPYWDVRKNPSIVATQAQITTSVAKEDAGASPG